VLPGTGSQSISLASNRRAAAVNTIRPTDLSWYRMGTMTSESTCSWGFGILDAVKSFRKNGFTHCVTPKPFPDSIDRVGLPHDGKNARISLSRIFKIDQEDRPTACSCNFNDSHKRCVEITQSREVLNSRLTRVKAVSWSTRWRSFSSVWALR